MCPSEHFIYKLAPSPPQVQTNYIGVPKIVIRIFFEKKTLDITQLLTPQVYFPTFRFGCE